MPSIASEHTKLTYLNQVRVHIIQTHTVQIRKTMYDCHNEHMVALHTEFFR